MIECIYHNQTSSIIRGLTGFGRPHDGEKLS